LALPKILILGQGGTNWGYYTKIPVDQTGIFVFSAEMLGVVARFLPLATRIVSFRFCDTLHFQDSSTLMLCQ